MVQTGLFSVGGAVSDRISVAETGRVGLPAEK